MTLVEIMAQLPKELYEILEMRRVNARTEEEQLREWVLANLSLVMSIEEMKSILKEVKGSSKEIQG